MEIKVRQTVLELSGSVELPAATSLTPKNLNHEQKFRHEYMHNVKTEVVKCFV